MAENAVSVGVDLGGTKIEVALVDAGGNIVKRLKESTDVQSGVGGIVDCIADSVQSLLKKAGVSNVVCAGVGMAGQINAQTGVVKFAPNFDWHDVPLKEKLHQALQLPVLVTNDVRAATWGEWNYGAGKGCSDLLCLFVGTGIGGGAVCGGKILTGDANCACEFGHITVDLNGRKCHCGNRGCLEAHAGGRSLAEIARELLSKNDGKDQPILRLADGMIENVTAKHVVQAAKEGDPLGRQLLEEVVKALIAGTTSLVNAFNPRRFVFSGGVIQGMPELVARVDKGVRNAALKAATEKLEIVQGVLEGEAGVVGAAAMALHHFNHSSTL